jgi:hypothetical protein
MNIQEALDKLEKKSITTSKQMLRRWIRQGKIKATLLSKKKGYIVDSESLDQFIEQKEKIMQSEKDTTSSISLEKMLQKEYGRGWQEGYNQGKKNKEGMIAETLRKKEIEFLKKGFFEEQYIFTRKDLAAAKKMTLELDKFLTLLEIDKVTINVIGSNARIENMLEMIDLRYLPNPNWRLKTRLRDEFIELMLTRLNEEKFYKKDC